MTHSPGDLIAHAHNYTYRLDDALQMIEPAPLQALGDAIRDCWRAGHQIFLCGNGGSAANAIHIANDFIYGAGRKADRGLKAIALSANSAVITCLANDVGYEHIFSEQLKVLASENDILIALSGSGNSPNILKALEQATSIGMKSFAILGYSGGKAKSMATTAIHVPVDDMQIAEDIQLVIGHILMQWLSAVSVETISQAA